MSEKCRGCGAALPPHTRGRRRDYCGLACRRALELRRRVWDRQYAALYAAALNPAAYLELPSEARARFENFTRENPRP